MSNEGSDRTLESSMIDFSEFKVLAGGSTKAGDIVQFEGSRGWHLRCESPSAEDEKERLQWLLDLEGDYPFTLYPLENVAREPAFVLQCFRLQVDPSSKKAVSSPHGMKAWAVRTENGFGVVADEPNSIRPRQLLIGQDGQFHEMEAGTQTFAFAVWRIVIGTADDLHVVYERKSEPEPA